MGIKDIKARMVYDSRGFPTVEAEVILDNNIVGLASVPSGASTGSNEALELRDNIQEEWLGKGVNTAVNNIITKIKPALIGMDITNQSIIDNKLLELDGTETKENLGANAILAVSLACFKANAKNQNKEIYEMLGGTKLPRPMVNIINGGEHADNPLSIQEFMIVPNGETIAVRLMKASTVFANLKKILKDKGLATGVGDEGGFAPNLNSTTETLDLILEAIKVSGYTPGTDIELALDSAASEFYNKEQDNYLLDGKTYTREELLNFYIDLVAKYPIISLEDPFDEADHVGFKLLTEKLGDKVHIVGDDLYVTNYKIFRDGIANKLSNAILIKPNQIGSLKETLETIQLALANNFVYVISHRSGETEDTTIAHIAVGTNAPFIKTGSMSRSERLAKYNELLRIEERLNKTP